MHVHVVATGQRLYGCHVRAKSEFPTLYNRDWSAKGDNPDRKSSVLQDSWGWAWGWQPHPGKLYCSETIQGQTERAVVLWEEETEWSASRPGCLATPVHSTVIYAVGSSVGSLIGLEVVKRRGIYCPPGIETWFLGCPARSVVNFTDWPTEP